MSSARHKGTCIAPIVAALRSHPKRDALVPKHLSKYFEQPVLVSGWYPNDDYFQLLEIVANAFERRQFGGDPWVRMGTAAAQRDIAGVQDVGEHMRIAQGGVYKKYGRVEGGIAGFVQRAAKIWSQYHDTGHYEIVGRIPGRTAFVRRMVGFHATVAAYARLQGAYVEEYARLVGLEMKVSVLCNTAQGDPHSEWVCDLKPSEETSAYLDSLADYAP